MAKNIVHKIEFKNALQKDPDFTFIIYLEPKGKNTLLHAIHSNLPDKHSESINSS